MVEEVKGYVALVEGSYNFFWKRLGSQMDAAARLLWSFVLVSIGFLDCSFCGIGRVRYWPPCCVAEASASTPFLCLSGVRGFGGDTKWCHVLGHQEDVQILGAAYIAVVRGPAAEARW